VIFLSTVVDPERYSTLREGTFGPIRIVARREALPDMRTREAVATEPEAPSSELLSMVDAALQDMVGRGLVESIEVVDLLLDLRSRMVLERTLEQLAGQSTEGN
jgi:hypothetical protein